VKDENSQTCLKIFYKYVHTWPQGKEAHFESLLHAVLKMWLESFTSAKLKASALQRHYQLFYEHYQCCLGQVSVQMYDTSLDYLPMGNLSS
jgi:hypothetical protein